MLWAACCTAFFGFLRVSEFTVPSQQSCEPFYHLSLSDIALDNWYATITVRLQIKLSKMDPFRKGAYIYLAKTNQQISPVQAIVRYLTIRGRKKGALFITSNGSMLTRDIFTSALTKILY